MRKNSDHTLPDTSSMDLFPETLGIDLEQIEYTSAALRNKYDQPRLTVRLLPKWDQPSGLWFVGWYCVIDTAVDEHLVLKETPPGYPWYRPADFPQAKEYQVAKAVAARAVKIVMEQMLGYLDEEIWPEVRAAQSKLESDAQRWLGWTVKRGRVLATEHESLG